MRNNVYPILFTGISLMMFVAVLIWVQADITALSNNGYSVSSKSNESNIDKELTTPVVDPKPIMCTMMDVKICPDGTAVARVAPACDFAPCPQREE